MGGGEAGLPESKGEARGGGQGASKEGARREHDSSCEQDTAIKHTKCFCCQPCCPSASGRGVELWGGGEGCAGEGWWGDSQGWLHSSNGSRTGLTARKYFEHQPNLAKMQTLTEWQTKGTSSSDDHFFIKVSQTPFNPISKTCLIPYKTLSQEHSEPKQV